MSPNQNHDNSQEGLTSTEKKVLLGEGTFLSVGFVVTIVVAVVYTVSLNGRIESQARASEDIKDEVVTIKQQYNDQTTKYHATLMEINTRLSRIEGKLNVEDK